jgi:hypothetical protein
LISVQYTSTSCEKCSNKNILRSAGKISKSSELVGHISEVQPPPLHFFKLKKKGKGGGVEILTKKSSIFPMPIAGYKHSRKNLMILYN